jgi:hypothetical protein
MYVYFIPGNGGTIAISLIWAFEPCLSHSIAHTLWLCCYLHNDDITNVHLIRSYPPSLCRYHFIYTSGNFLMMTKLTGRNFEMPPAVGWTGVSSFIYSHPGCGASGSACTFPHVLSIGRQGIPDSIVWSNFYKQTQVLSGLTNCSYLSQISAVNGLLTIGLPAAVRECLSPIRTQPDDATEHSRTARACPLQSPTFEMAYATGFISWCGRVCSGKGFPAGRHFRWGIVHTMAGLKEMKSDSLKQRRQFLHERYRYIGCRKDTIWLCRVFGQELGLYSSKIVAPRI